MSNARSPGSPTEMDTKFMRLALDEARAAASAGEVPIGCIVVANERILARAANRTIADCDPTAHAEMIALRAAAAAVKNHRLAGTTLYVSIEPCAMCAGAILQARIDHLVYGADDPKGGAVRSCFAVFDHPRVNHRTQVTSGILADEAASLLREFLKRVDSLNRAAASAVISPDIEPAAQSEYTSPLAY